MKVISIGIQIVSAAQPSGAQPPSSPDATTRQATDAVGNNRTAGRGEWFPAGGKAVPKYVRRVPVGR